MGFSSQVPPSQGSRALSCSSSFSKEETSLPHKSARSPPSWGWGGAGKSFSYCLCCDQTPVSLFVCFLCSFFLQWCVGISLWEGWTSASCLSWVQYLPDSHSPDSGPTARKGAQAALLASLVLQLVGRFLYLLPDALVSKIPLGSLRARCELQKPHKGTLIHVRISNSLIYKRGMKRRNILCCHVTDITPVLGILETGGLVVNKALASY